MKIKIEYFFDRLNHENPCGARTVLDGEQHSAQAEDWEAARFELIQFVRTYMQKPQEEEVEVEAESEPESEPEAEFVNREPAKPASKVKKK